MDCFKIIGIAMETTNQNGQSLHDIEKLWGRFWGEDIQSQVPNRVNTDIYAVYTDYENQDLGKYTIIIGLPVITLDDIPKGFTGRELCIGKSQKFVSKGKMPEAIVKTWTEIWENKALKRAFHVDVTIHGAKYYDGDNAEVETYISIL
ncbi:AraC family transcriptional regulator [Flagellimonas allohymeniacidonis]|uniref:AraC family transcriptional regulator n=1 Tax=Flagellimonas allohymeniacidonis TaxID=2517819 RepID=A0A4Q8QEX8_9FLAO|nr:AraC family transcriptional regulator [Allomuricauda hymeniacidonis]